MLAVAGEISAGRNADDPRGGWIFDRFSLDKYREAQMLQVGDIKKDVDQLLKQAALDINDLV